MKKTKGSKKRNCSKSSQIGDEREKRRKISANQNIEISKEEICDVCGHIGFINALLYCSACSHTVVHQYCLGIPPGSIDDTYYWLCEYCSILVESQHHNSSFEESSSKLASALESETEQYKSVAILVEDEVEPLCILPPLVHQGCPKHQCGIDEFVSNTSSTLANPLLCSKEKYDLASSTHGNKEDILVNGSISLDHPLNDREESEANVSSLMEFPKEIMSGLVLLVSLSGTIDIQRGMGFCACSTPLIENMTNDYNEMNSKKLVKEPVNTYHGNAEGADHSKCQKIKRKRKTRIKIDLIQPLGPECKRVRSKRCKKSSSLNKEVYAQATGVPSIGKEGSGRSTNDSQILRLRNTHHATVQADTLVNIDPLTIDELRFKAIYKNCGSYAVMVETSCNNVKAGVEIHNRFCDQESNSLDLGLDGQTLFFDNECSNRDLAFAQQNGNVIFSSNEGIGKSKSFTSISSTSAPSCMQIVASSKVCMKDFSPCTPCDVEMIKQKRDIEGDLDENAPHIKEVYNVADLGSSLLKSNLQGNPLLCGSDLTFPMLKLVSSTQFLDGEQAIVEREHIALVEASNNVKKLKESISYPNAWKEYDRELEKLKIDVDIEKKKLEEVVKKNRRKVWKIVFELENTKKELEVKTAELAKKAAEVEMVKELVLTKNEDFVKNQREAFDLWLAGYSSAERVIYELHPELNWGGIKAVDNLMFLRYG